MVLFSHILPDSALENWIDKQADCRCGSNNEGLGEPLHLPEKQYCGKRDRGGRNVNNGTLSQDHDGPSDRPDRCGGNAIDEGDNGWPLAVLSEIRRRNDGEKVAWQKVATAAPGNPAIR